MPNRIIRESARTSPTLEALSDGAERLFWRLILAADDYGRFDADPRILLAECFPLRVDRLKLRQIERWRDELLAVGAVRLYAVEGRPYGYFVSWDKHQRVRTKRSKFPDPPDGGGDFATIGPQRQIPIEIRRAVLERDRVCLACDAPAPLVLDHVIAVDAGGLAVAENLQVLCQGCNAAKATRHLDFRQPGEAEQQFAAIRRKLRPYAATGGEMRPESNPNPDENPNPNPDETPLSSLRSESPPGGANGASGEEATKRRTRRVRARLPDEWAPSEDAVAYGKSLGFTDADLERVVDEFCTYWWGEGKAKADWDRTFENRLLQIKHGGHR